MMGKIVDVYFVMFGNGLAADWEGEGWYRLCQENVLLVWRRCDADEWEATYASKPKDLRAAYFHKTTRGA